MRHARCENCESITWVNVCTHGGANRRELCADCFETQPHDEPNRNRTVRSSGNNHNDPGLDNAIRALEDGIND